MAKKASQTDPLADLKAAANEATGATVENMESGTLAGDIRDVILTHFRSIKVPWSMLAEDEQADKIGAIEQLARDISRRAVFLVAASKMPVLHVQLGKWTVDKGHIKREFTLAATADNINHFSAHEANSAVLVLTDPGAYMGEREAARADPDQRPLPFDPGTGEIRNPDPED